MDNTYNHCYFAFLDLLGFKEIVKTRTCSEIVEIFNEAKKTFFVMKSTDDKVEVPVIPPEDIHYYIMSDSICIYVKDDFKDALPILTWICMDFQVRMLCLETPVLVRGSISRGEIFEKQGIMFGPAMVEAYLRAETLAHVPRVVIPTHLYDEMVDNDDKTMFETFAYREQDEFYVTSYIPYFCHHNSTINCRENVNNHIRKMLNISMDQSVRDKYLYVKTWMEFYNQKGTKLQAQ